MEYVRLHIHLVDELHDIVIAELFEMGFEGFEQETGLLIASVPSAQFDNTQRETVHTFLSSIKDASVEKEEVILPQNWNRKWEESIEPQYIGDFVVRPTWSEEPEIEEGVTELFIDPKMAFGTGYHATTRLILEWISEIVNPNDKVLDAGTGTGILGIAALKCGAESVFGFDIDEWSEENSKENIELNKVQNFVVKQGSVEMIPEGSEYDVILANINRNALIELIPHLLNYLKKGGKLLLSGLLENDEATMLGLDSVKALSHLETRQNGEWIAILFEK